jgi:hypothetical protein
MLFELVNDGVEVVDSWLNIVNNILRSVANDAGPDEVSDANDDECYD